MKKALPLFLALITSVVIGQTPCVSGFAGSYPCSGYDLQAHFFLAEMGASDGNDSWGWTDPADGAEYAIIGLNNGTAFFDISTPTNPTYLGKLATATGSSFWRDVKVYNNFAFIVSDANGSHGMQIFDLTKLRNVANPPATFTEDAHYSGFGSSHNIVINEETGYAYAVGNNTFGGGPHFINIQNPLAPIPAGGYSAGGYTHDAQVIVYDGPDTEHVGKEILFGSNETHVAIVDVTNKANPQLIANIAYPSVGYTHQGWLTDDRNYFLLGDEGDEFDFGFNTRTVIFDVSDLDNPSFKFEYFGPTAAVDHNGYVIGNKFYLANYAAGLRTIDISDIDNENMTEIGSFDTHPGNNNASYNGSWNVYPFFASGNIVISGSNGFTLVKSANLGVNDATPFDFVMAPNPAMHSVTISSQASPISEIAVYNLVGQQIQNHIVNNSVSETLDISALSSGMYLVKINNTTTKRLLIN
ncbi:choice-of-anchor B domain-containing protein [Ulvibacter sp. MAR_2010_11]|uniref:choice-of-anchor B family protein n=1 Tax=Ulvibacter sp. MAR_2010_11 TaxID=1250229 RepID=UPI000C2BF4B2|nr:choice-of-anchor B family protein [Ulvibacter sp. MAR_2010_11]PKA82768.1 choice-of-anchor B domain-containing protein [Ulvibacter sp. MAR_2010_11]